MYTTKYLISVWTDHRLSCRDPPVCLYVCLSVCISNVRLGLWVPVCLSVCLHAHSLSVLLSTSTCLCVCVNIIYTYIAKPRFSARKESALSRTGTRLQTTCGCDIQSEDFHSEMFPNTYNWVGNYENNNFILDTRPHMTLIQTNTSCVMALFPGFQHTLCVSSPHL